jgi:hypothetical protein
MAGALNIEQNKLSVQVVENQLVPKEGPKAIPLFLDFTLADTYNLDLQLMQPQGFFSMLQTIFVDLSMTDIAMTIVIGGLQTVVVKGRTQVYVPVLASNPVKLSFTNAGGPNNVRVILINVAIPGVVWPSL